MQKFHLSLSGSEAIASAGVLALHDGLQRTWGFSISFFLFAIKALGGVFYDRTDN
jgi:hypothetical protein